jgi:preprotein translocase subunit SecE
MYSAVLVFVLIMIAIVGLLDLAFGWGLLKIFGS